MTVCPVCKVRPAYVGLAEVGPCERCHSNGGCTLSRSEPRLDDPTGLSGELLRQWMRENPGVDVVCTNPTMARWVMSGIDDEMFWYRFASGYFGSCAMMKCRYENMDDSMKCTGLYEVKP